MVYRIDLHSGVVQDLKHAIDYYDQQQSNLGKKFLNAIDKHFFILSKNPFYQIRYDNVRCLPVKKFPFMIHFTIEEGNKTVKILAVLNTSLDPQENWAKRM